METCIPDTKLNNLKHLTTSKPILYIQINSPGASSTPLLLSLVSEAVRSGDGGHAHLLHLPLDHHPHIRPHTDQR